MVYSDNPYIDIIVHNTKMLGIDTVLKMPAEADRYEDKESHSHGDKLLMCKDGTVTLKLLYDGGGVPEEVLRKAGLGGILLFECMKVWPKFLLLLKTKFSIMEHNILLIIMKISILIIECCPVYHLQDMRTI